ncbi:MAG: peptide-binding protein, partial [Candidatus Omnitrophica bacterium]|nr:peptide-binding protein [Candidatus Omnitrophota bacterium]
WHDGEPFTSEDVEFTFKKIIDPEVPTPYSGDFKKVKTFEVLDKHTIKITYEEAFVPALSSWSMKIMPKHLLFGKDLLTCDFSRDPVGTGPYVFKKWKESSRIDLFANKQYFEHRPYVDRYIFRVIPDNGAMFVEMLVGNIDQGSLSPLQYTKLTDTSSFEKKFNKYSLPSFGYTYMGYNLNNPLFKDKQIRIALNYAVDKNEIIKGVLLGKGEVCTGPFIKNTLAYNDNVIPMEYDPEKAKEMLLKAGWEDIDNNGWVEKNGKIFEFTILTNQGNFERSKTAQIIQRRLKTIGVKVNIRNVEWAVLINEFINKKRFDAVLLGWNLSPEPDCWDIWHSTKTKPGEFNFISYENLKVDELLVEGRKTFDMKKREQIYNDIHELIYNDQPYMFLYVPDTLIALSKRFENVSVSPAGLEHNFIDWYVSTEKQKYTMVQ